MFKAAFKFVVELIKFLVCLQQFLIELTCKGEENKGKK